MHAGLPYSPQVLLVWLLGLDCLATEATPGCRRLRQSLLGPPPPLPPPPLVRSRAAPRICSLLIIFSWPSRDFRQVRVRAGSGRGVGRVKCNLKVNFSPPPQGPRFWELGHFFQVLGAECVLLFADNLILAKAISESGYFHTNLDVTLNNKL
jgi:hypothetical protein